MRFLKTPNTRHSRAFPGHREKILKSNFIRGCMFGSELKIVILQFNESPANSAGTFRRSSGVFAFALLNRAKLPLNS